MAWTFNPFSGTFDQKGSGGGGASYIDGEVATYADLPLDGSATLNSAWLVRTASGVWPVTRKQAGIYIRTATGGSNRDSDYTYAGTMPDVFSDSQFLLYDNTDTSKNLAFDLGNITTGTTRTLTAPNASGTISLTGHTHAASDVTSGTFDNARINFAAPSAIGSTTAAAGTFTTLTANSTVSLGDGTTFQGIAALLYGNASTRYSYLRHEANAGLTYEQNATNANSILLSGNGVAVKSVAYFGWGGSNATNAGDLFLRRDAAGTLAQYNGTNAQTFNIYNTFTSSTNHERGFLRWSSNVFQIGTEKGSGGGTARNLEFQTDGVTRLTVQTGGTVALTSHLTAENGFIRIASAQAFQWLNRSKIYSLADGNIGFYNAGENGFNLLQLGGTTSSFPALKRSSAILQARLADDSGYTTMDALHRLQGTAPATTGATGTAGDIRYDADYIYVCTATNTWKRVAIATW